VTAQQTGFVWDERYGWHDTGTFAGGLPSGGFLQPYRHFESPESKQRLAQLVAVSGLGAHLKHLAARPASEEEVLRVHTVGHLAHLREQSAHPRGGLCEDGISPIGHGSYEIALLAAGGTIVAADAVVAGLVPNAYALVRPPGHHATPDTGMGFCMINNIAVAIEYARAERGIGRVAVVDWDVHHGNGTQDVYIGDPDVLTISLHQDRCFPSDSGYLQERGRGAGVGAALNVPLPPGSGQAAYLDAMDRVVLPALAAFRPELIVVGCGFDAGVLDPLARQMLTVATFRALARRVRDAAERLCDGRLLMVHEGGYSPVYVPFCGLAVLEVLSGVDTGVGDPFEPLVAGMAGHELEDHQRAVVDRAAALVGEPEVVEPVG
jgi:acetoin utilization deacetylase AcuC-like enzyme